MMDLIQITVKIEFFKQFMVVDLFTFYAFKNVVFSRTVIYIKIAISVRQRAVSLTKIALIHAMITNDIYATSGIVIFFIVTLREITIVITTRAFSRRYGLK